MSQPEPSRYTYQQMMDRLRPAEPEEASSDPARKVGRSGRRRRSQQQKQAAPVKGERFRPGLFLLALLGTMLAVGLIWFLTTYHQGQDPNQNETMQELRSIGTGR